MSDNIFFNDDNVDDLLSKAQLGTWTSAKQKAMTISKIQELILSGQIGIKTPHLQSEKAKRAASLAGRQYEYHQS